MLLNTKGGAVSLVKTEKGRDELAARGGVLGPRARQILVLSNGSRSQSDLVALLGNSAEGIVQHLLGNGYLVDARFGDINKVPEAVLTSTGTFFVSDEFTTTHADIVVAAPPAQTPENAPLPPSAFKASKRSLAATKMYTIDMLQLVRDPDASAMAVNVHTADTPGELIEHVLTSLRLIRYKSGASYALRVAGRLQDTIPVEFAIDLDALVAEFESERAASAA